MSVAYNHAVPIVRDIRTGGGAGVWVARELAILANLYPRAPWPDLLAALPGRSKRAIEIRANKANVVRTAQRKPAWTGAEQAILQRMFSKATWQALCLAIPRHSKEAIDQRGHAMKLRRPPKNKLRSRYGIIRELREVRRQSHIRQDALAKKIGVGKHCLCAWELGIVVPRLPSLLDWVDSLGFKIVIVRKPE